MNLFLKIFVFVLVVLPTLVVADNKPDLTADPKIVKFLEALNLQKYVNVFSEEEVDFEIMHHLTSQDLEKMGIKTGSRLKILKALKKGSSEHENHADKDHNRARNLQQAAEDSLTESPVNARRLDSQQDDDVHHVAEIQTYLPTENPDHGGFVFLTKNSVSEGVTQKLWLTPDGSLGVKTPRPDATLHVAGTLKVGTLSSPKLTNLTGDVTAYNNMNIIGDLSVGSSSTEMMSLKNGRLRLNSHFDSNEKKDSTLRVDNTHASGVAMHIVEPYTTESHTGLYIGSPGMDKAVLSTRGGRVGIGREPRERGPILDVEGDASISKSLAISGSISTRNISVAENARINGDLALERNLHGKNATFSGLNVTGNISSPSLDEMQNSMESMLVTIQQLQSQLASKVTKVTSPQVLVPKGSWTVLTQSPIGWGRNLWYAHSSTVSYSQRFCGYEFSTVAGSRRWAGYSLVMGSVTEKFRTPYSGSPVCSFRAVWISDTEYNIEASCENSIGDGSSYVTLNNINVW